MSLFKCDFYYNALYVYQGDFMSSNIEKTHDINSVKNLTDFIVFIDSLTKETKEKDENIFFGKQFTYHNVKGLTQSIQVDDIFVKLSQLNFDSDSYSTIEKSIIGKFNVKIGEKGQTSQIVHDFINLFQVQNASESIIAEQKTAVTELGKGIILKNHTSLKIFANICNIWKKCGFDKCPYIQAISDVWMQVIRSKLLEEAKPFFKAMVSSKLDKNSSEKMRLNFKKNTGFEASVSIIEAGAQVIKHGFSNKESRKKYISELIFLRKELHALKRRFDGGDLSRLPEIYQMQIQIKELKSTSARIVKEGKVVAAYLGLYNKSTNLSHLELIRQEFKSIIVNDPLEDWSFPYDDEFIMPLSYARTAVSEIKDTWENFLLKVELLKKELAELSSQPLKDDSKIRELQKQIEQTKNSEENLETIETIDNIYRIYSSLTSKYSEFDEEAFFAQDRVNYNIILQYRKQWKDL